MTCPTIFDHVPHHILEFLEVVDALRFRATCRCARETVKGALTTVDVPFLDPEHMERFLTHVVTRPVLHLTLRSNTLRAVRTVDASFLHTLTLARCNLTPARIAEYNVAAWLQRATRLHTLNVAENPLTSAGAQTLLMAIRSPVLERLSLAHCSIRKLDPASVSSGYFASVVSLNLADNRLAAFNDDDDDDVSLELREFLRSFGSLQLLIIERLVAPLEEVLGAHPGLASVLDVSWRDLNDLWTAVRRPQVRSVTLRCVRGPTRLMQQATDRHLGFGTLQCLGLISTHLLLSEWSALLGSFARHCAPRALTLWGTNVSASTLIAFVRELRQPTQLVALSLCSVEGLSTESLRRFCEAVVTAGVRLQYLTIQECDSIEFGNPDDGALLASTMDARRAVKLDLNRPQSYGVDDSQYLERVLKGLPTLRKVIVSGWTMAFAAAAFPCPRIEFLNVSNADIGWTPQDLSMLRHVDMTMLRGEKASLFFEQVLTNPRVQTVCASLNVFPWSVAVPMCRHLETLNLDSCQLSLEFRASFLAALRRGCLPVLALLSFYSVESYQYDFTVGLVEAMKEGQRGCRLNARGRSWDTECRLHYLGSSLRNVSPGALSALCITANVYLAGTVLDVQRTLVRGGVELVVSYL